ncbi:MAG: glycerol-3-phosphate dehydrogenase [Gemmataceae bacterium]
MKRDPDALHRGTFDLVVLGGGITGAGVALDATLRGLRVGLIDKGDFASGTSSISSKLVHGGIRYLEQGQLGLVYEALHERRRLLHNAPHLVWPLKFVIPFYADSRMPSWKYRLGLLLYDLLAGRGSLQWSRGHSREWMRSHFPTLRPEALTGGAEYADAQMDDARLCIEVLRTASAHGAAVCNYVEAVRIVGGTVSAVDHLTNRELTIPGKVVINATGPWSDRVRALAGEGGEPLLAPTKGVHLVVPAQRHGSAFLLLHPRDGRVFFVLPWLGKTLLGTTDTDCPGPPDALAVTEEDIAYLLEGYNHHFRPGLQRSDLLGHFVGVRPLARTRPGEPSARSREWRLVEGGSGLLTVVGGKYTTYRHMAEKVTDRVMRRLGRRGVCRTRAFRLAGAFQETEMAAAQERIVRLSQLGLLSEASGRHLVRRYGRCVSAVLDILARDPALGRPVVEGEPDVLAEFVYHRDQEMACRPEDFLLRRTRLGLFHPKLLASPPPLAVGG